MRRRRLHATAAVVGLLVVLVSCGALAHEMRPALLTIESEQGDTLIELTWDADRTDATPRLVAAESCPTVFELHERGVYTARLACDPDAFLAESELHLTPTTPDAMVRVHTADGVETFVVARQDPRLGSGSVESSTSFVRLGFEHILEGLDHLLFVLGLLLVLLPASGAFPSIRRLTLAITAFTVAHSITLALSVLDLVRLPSSGVEAAIAASLVLLGLEALHVRDTWTRRAPHGVAFAFGLLHGFGFAGALREIGLPQDDIAGALFAFNVGVELGQLAFLAVCVVALALVRKLVPRIPWAVAGAYAVGTMGMMWLFERGFPIVAGVIV